MIDSQTRREIRVSIDGTSGPYIMVPVDRLSHIRERLDERNIPYWVDSDAISLDGKPAVAILNLRHSGDAKSVQAILDNAP